jgi:hypothetical protein
MYLNTLSTKVTEACGLCLVLNRIRSFSCRPTDVKSSAQFTSYHILLNYCVLRQRGPIDSHIQPASEQALETICQIVNTCHKLIYVIYS